jgi:hypothetical protein
VKKTRFGYRSLTYEAQNAGELYSTHYLVLLHVRAMNQRQDETRHYFTSHQRGADKLDIELIYSITIDRYIRCDSDVRMEDI